MSTPFTSQFWIILSPLLTSKAEVIALTKGSLLLITVTRAIFLNSENLLHQAHQ